MTQRIYRVLLLVVVALALPALASLAAPFTPALEADYAFAANWWGATPTNCSSIDHEVVFRDSISNDGNATMPNLGDPPVPCHMFIAAGLDSACYRREVVLHEYGHLLGHDHSDNPKSIMYPGVGYQFICRHERAAEFQHALSKESRRCRNLSPGPHRLECWRGVHEESRAYKTLLASFDS